MTNMFGEYSYGKHIPDSIKRINNKSKSSLIHGYLDSDGSVFLDNGKVRVNFTSVNLRLLEDV